MFDNKILAALLIIGALIRLWFFNSESLSTWVQNRLEIANPLTSWNRVLEGIYLKNKIRLSSTYEGDLVHELPMMLNFYEALINIPIHLRYIFIIFDALNAILVYLIVNKSICNFYTNEQSDMKKGKYHRLVECFENDSELNKFLLNSDSFNSDYWALISFSFYLFNPFCIASCVATSTVIIHNTFLLLWFALLVNHQTSLSLFFLAIHANLTVYSGSLVIATIFFLHRNQEKKKPVIQLVVKNLFIFILHTISIFLFNYWLENFNTRFITCTYLFILGVPDLAPNLGVFWYFFTEMFDHFRLFFTYVFQFNVLLYALPISFRLRHDPIIGILIQIGLISTLKSYPSIGETGMFMAFVPMTAYLFPLFRNFLIYSCMLVASVILAPIMFYLWVGSGGGNANFYFAITLVYSVGLTFLIVDIFYAQLKREFIKLNGTHIPKNKVGKLAQFHLE